MGTGTFNDEYIDPATVHMLLDALAEAYDYVDNMIEGSNGDDLSDVPLLRQVGSALRVAGVARASWSEYEDADYEDGPCAGCGMADGFHSADCGFLSAEEG